MIAKIIPVNSVANTINYVMEKEGAELLDSNIVRAYDLKLMIEDFNYNQTQLDSRVKTKSFHVAISLDKNDQLTSDTFKEICNKVILGMGWSDCPYLICRHFDQKSGNPHCHIIVGRCGLDGKATENRFSFQRMNTIRIEIEKQYPFLKAASGKNLEAIDESRLKGNDAIKFLIYKAISQELLLPTENVKELLDRLKDKHGIISQVINNDRNIGLLFSVIGKPGWVKSSQVDKLFTLQQLERTIEDKRPNNNYSKEAANEQSKTKFFHEYLSDRINQMEETKLIFESKNDPSLTSPINGLSVPETKNGEIFHSINIERREEDNLYIKEAIKAEIYQVSSIEELLSRLNLKYDIFSIIKFKGESDAVQGITFSLKGTENWIEESELKKEFSYTNLTRAIEQNIIEGETNIKPIISIESIKQNTLLEINNNLSSLDESKLLGDENVNHFIYKAIIQELLLPTENVKELLDRLKDKHGIINQVNNNDRNVDLLFSVLDKPGWIKSSQPDKLFAYQQLQMAIEDKWPNHTYSKEPPNEQPKTKFQKYLSDRKNQMAEAKFIFESKNNSSITSPLNGLPVPETNKIEIYNSINIERREEDKLYIKKAIKAEIYQVSSIDDLLNNLDIKYGICTKKKFKGQTAVVQGIKFSIKGTENWIRGSELKKEFSYINLTRAIEKNIVEGKVDIKATIINLMNQGSATPHIMNSKEIPSQQLNKIEIEHLKSFIKESVKEAQLVSKSIEELVKILKNEFEIIIDTEPMSDGEEVNLLFTVGDIDIIFSEEELQTGIDAYAIESIIEEEDDSGGKLTKFSQKSKHTFSSGSEGNKHKRKGKPIFSENDPKVRNFGLNGEIYFKNPKRKR